MGGFRQKLPFAATVLCLCAFGVATAQPADDDATCDITCDVNNVMKWSGNFSAINLADITAMSTESTGSATPTLVTNAAADITADNSTTAQLSEPGGEALVTEYQISFDGDGSSNTGGAGVGTWTAYNNFLSTATTVTYVTGDGNVDVTLEVRASSDGVEITKSATYSATQTLTASWAGT